jgi:hypothetical protein
MIKMYKIKIKSKIAAGLWEDNVLICTVLLYKTFDTYFGNPCSFTGDSLESAPLERSYKCRVLGHYSESVPWNPFDRNAIGMMSVKL